MNSQGSSSNSFPEIFMADHGNHGIHGNDVNNLGFVQSNVNPMESAVRDSPTVINWMGPYSSSMINHNQVNPQELFGGHRWLSSIGAAGGSGQGFQVSRSGTNVATFEEGSTSFFQSGYGAGLSLSLFNPDGLEAHQNQQSGTSSVPVVISSGVAGYVLEENNSREDLSSDGRRVSCKRRAPEDVPGLLYLGESSRYAQESGNLEWRALSAQENANANLNLSSPSSIPPNAGHPERLEDGIGISMTGALSGMLQTSSGAGQEEGSQRNIRVRRSADPQDFVPPSICSSGTSRDSYPQPDSLPAVFSPFDSFPNPSSAAPLPVDGTNPVHSFAHVPNSLQNLQSSPWYDLTIPPVYAVNGGSTFQQQGNSMSIPRNTLLAPETERGYVAEYPTAYHLFNGHSNSPGNIASSSQNGTLSGVHFPYARTRVPEHNMTEQYRQRFSDSVNRFMVESTGFECRELGIYCPLHSRTSAAAREMDLSVRSDVIPVQIHQAYGWTTGTERQAGGYSENPFALEFVGAAQRTRRLVSEVRNVMALLRMGGSLWFEDVMVIDQSILYGVPEEEDDMNEDMRLDVDNMSYEELLDLEEHIGSVSTGLSEEAIVANLRRQTYDSLTLGSPAVNESCCICQEEYVNGDDLGNLDCGHGFHFDCIKQWLVQKNSCPICKMRALAVRDGVFCSFSISSFMDEPPPWKIRKF
ncbi:E3 ubiquitin-protein ligase MBR2-like [Juglans microcarpa x Juglans regia]|uniref:E3 ubiquitin-protein ligase MBR2-like n=1 Tax=Juglans microcarpa x Juglans regia TaxID=2249226 RepID=UPI001B7F43D8|nr:E3 ubiquitin-protein ligase MBR2-like [Juglans microcarpa x Juglans regia]